MGSGIPNPGAGPQTNLTGPLRVIVGEYDGYIFVPAKDWQFDSGTWTLTRSAAGVWYRALTAAANSPNIAFDLRRSLLGKYGPDPMVDFGSNYGVANPPVGNPPSGTNGVLNQARSAGAGAYPFQTGHVFRGIQIVEVDVVFSIGTANLTTLAAKISQTKYANNAAPVVVDKTPLFTGAAALPVATQAQPYVKALPCTAPYVLGNNDAGTDDVFELEIANPGTSVFNLYGAFVKFNYVLL